MSENENRVSVVSNDPGIFDVDYPLDNLNFLPSFQAHDNTRLFEGLFYDSQAVAELILGQVIDQCSEILYVNCVAKKGPDFMLSLLKSRLHLAIETEVCHLDKREEEVYQADDEPEIPVMDTWGRTIVKPGRKRDFKERTLSTKTKLTTL
jgi:hypothetical protein